MTDRERSFDWGSVVAAALLPTFLFSVGEAAIIPMIPVVAQDLGASLALAGFTAGLLIIGHLIGDVPSGVIVARFGERSAMIGAAVLSLLGLVLGIFATHPIVLGIGVLLVGIAGATFSLARHAFMTTYVPVRYRARAISTLGGVYRLGFLVGPFLSAALIAVTDDPQLSFGIALAASVAAVIALLVLRDPESIFSGGQQASQAVDPTAINASRGLFHTIAANRHVLWTLGVGAAIVSALRQARQVVLPLWAVSIGLDPTTTSVIIGLAGVIDFSLFFFGGWIMDRYGRLWTALPSLLGLAIGDIVLSMTHELDARELWFIAITAFLSLANGIGAGILMTLGADLADPSRPAPFLGAWRFTNDAGGATAPIIIAGITVVAGLPIAVATLGVLGIAGAVILRVFLPRFSRLR